MHHHLEDLSAILADCVVGGGGVTFMLPFTNADAQPFWRRVAETAASGRLVVLGAYVDCVLAGRVQLALVPMPNQPHRAEVTKLLVAPGMRRRGIARKLMLALEHEAKVRNRSLITLDTVTGDAAESLYASLGYVKVGVIPGYAMMPAGGLSATTIFYKQL
ncbi:MAG: GNAT family N-acetyltransferase [Pseudomonadota bacterium]|nr:GNAT family N-acetyltransferase [Pseudomonadota bacterium]